MQNARVMKRIHILALTLSLLGLCLSAVVQPAIAQDNKKVILIRKKIDQNGQETIEKTVTTGDAAELTLQEIEIEEQNGECKVIINSCEKIPGNVMIPGDGKEHIVKVNVEDENGERVISVDIDGEVEQIRLAPGEELSDEVRARLQEKGVKMLGDGVICVDTTENDKCFFDLNFEGLGKGLVRLSEGLAGIGDFSFGRDHWACIRDINCAALGVYVSSNDPDGVFVSSTIGESGAEEAGLQRGDVITFIDDYPTLKYGQLHEALGMYEPGDVVTVTFDREGEEHRVDAQLRAWKDLPSFCDKPHAQVTCDQDNPEMISRKIIVIKKDRVKTDDTPPNLNQRPGTTSVDNILPLEDFTVFPNPTDGKFHVEFSADPVPTVVSIYNTAGKEIFRDMQDAFSGHYSREIDLSDQSLGPLVLSVEQDGKVFTEKIIVN
jgi:hypothetical protein